jgi:hypothetical protein
VPFSFGDQAGRLPSALYRPPVHCNQTDDGYSPDFFAGVKALAKAADAAQRE